MGLISSVHNGNLNKEFLDVINYHSGLVREFNGYWTTLNRKQTVYVNVFAGENLITENNDGYINVFLPKFNDDTILDVNEVFNDLRKHIEFLKNEVNPKVIYVHLYFENTNDLIIRDMINLRSGFKLLACVVKKEVHKIEPVNINSDFYIRVANRYDIESIFRCLEEGYINGTEYEQISNIGIDKFKKNIRKYHENLLSDHNLVLVAEKNKEFCGHITFNLNGDKNFIDGISASLIDVFVLDKFKKLGLEQNLTKFAEIECHRIGKYSLIGTMKHTDTINDFFRKLNNLNNSGWSNYSVIFNKIY